MNRLLVVLSFFIVLAAETVLAQAEDSTVVFGCNYTISISVDGQDFSVSHQDRVRNGSAIPFNLQDFLLQLRVTEAESATATIELILSEKTADGWHQIYATPPSFTVNLGAPAEFKYSDDIATFEVSLIASKIVL